MGVLPKPRGGVVARLAAADRDVFRVVCGNVLYEVVVEPRELVDRAPALLVRTSEDLFADMYVEAGGGLSLGQGEFLQACHRLVPEIHALGVAGVQRDGLYLDAEAALAEAAVAFALEPVAACAGDGVEVRLVAGVHLQFHADLPRLVRAQRAVVAAVAVVVVAVHAGVGLVAGVSVLDSHSGDGCTGAYLFFEEGPERHRGAAIVPGCTVADGLVGIPRERAGGAEHETFRDEAVLASDDVVAGDFRYEERAVEQRAGGVAACIEDVVVGDDAETALFVLDHDAVGLEGAVGCYVDADFGISKHRCMVL